MGYIITAWIVVFLLVILFLMITDSIEHAPKWLRKWWKDNVVDDFPYSDDDWHAN